MFTKAIVRKPCKKLVNGLTTASLGKPDYYLALLQHQKYVAALQKCGLNVTVLDADQNYPDSTFIEDVALLTAKCAIITNPGAQSRQGEVSGMDSVLNKFYTAIEYITPPGTVEGGDILMVENHFYIGLSERTNKIGADQLIKIINRYGYSASTIELKKVLHLKTGVAYLGDGNLLACGEFISNDQFNKYNVLQISADESYAANCISINGSVIVAQGYPETKSLIEHAGYPTIAIDVSEFRKLDGGMSCLSLRF